MNTANGSSPAHRDKPRAYDIISIRLREYHDEIAMQPVPDRLLELLARLDSLTAPQKNNS